VHSPPLMTTWSGYLKQSITKAVVRTSERAPSTHVDMQCFFHPGGSAVAPNTHVFKRTTTSHLLSSESLHLTRAQQPVRAEREKNTSNSFSLSLLHPPLTLGGAETRPPHRALLCLSNSVNPTSLSLYSSLFSCPFYSHTACIFN